MADTNTSFETAATDAVKPQLTSVSELKSQATQAAETAKNSVNALATEARGKVQEIVDHQKQAGADHLAGFARAAQSAAGDLEKTSPAAARLVRDAASSVDNLAGNLRSGDLRDVVSSVTTFARQQPVAFFAGSVLAGFVLARFLKSDAEARNTPSPDGQRTAAGSDFRSWSANHADDVTL